MTSLPAPAARQSAVEALHRAAYLAEVLRLLYPRGGGEREYLILPTAGRPRMLVPRGTAAGGIVRYAGWARRWPDRWARRAAAAALDWPATGTLLPHRVRVEPAGSIEEHLHRLTGRPVRLGIRIGAARANRKPVLQLARPDGSPAGFAKLGTGPLTRRLVRTEAAALATVAGLRLRQLAVPALWHAGRWGAHELLLQSPLPTWRRPATAHPARLVMAMRELAFSHDGGVHPLGGSRYWQRLAGRVAEVAAGGPVGGGTEGGGPGMLAAAATGLLDRAGEVPLRYGAWHGDWSPWNMAVSPAAVLLWDWERFDTDVPVGFDALHHHMQSRLENGEDPDPAVAATVAGAGALLAGFQVPAAAAPATAALYLLELATRYLADRQAGGGGRLGLGGSRLLPALLRQLARLTGRTRW